MSSSLAVRRAGASLLRMGSDVDGVTSIEYALIGVVIMVAIVAAVASLGTSLTSAFQSFAAII